MGSKEQGPGADVAPALIDRETAAGILGCSVRTVSKLAEEGYIIRVSRGPGRKPLGFNRESVERFARGEAGKAVPHVGT